MKRFLCFVFVFHVIYLTNGSSVRNVRLVDHTSYALNIIQETMKKVEQNQWCNLKLDNVAININQNILGTPVSGVVQLTNGFVISIRSIDVLRTTVQQVWVPVSVNTTSVEVRATMRMNDVAIGFDVMSRMSTGNYRSTVVILYPDIQYRFTVVKDLFTDKLSTSVFGLIMRVHREINFIPKDEVTKLIPLLYQWNSTGESFNKMGTDIFAPIALDIATSEIDFPTICYNCNV